MSSYKDIAKSSGLIGLVQVAQMVFSLLRNKAISVLLGSAAFGLYSLYNTFVEMGRVFAMFGLNNSLVRELSRCKGDRERIGKVYYVCNRLVLTTSTVVCVVTLVFAGEIGRYMFNEDGHASGVRCVAGVVLAMVAAMEGYSVLNGIRSLRHLAVSQIVSSGIGSLGTVLAILLWREKAIPAALGIIGVTMAVVTFWYVRKDGVREVKATRAEFRGISRTLLYIGAGVSVAGLVSTVMTFLGKSFLTEHYTLSAVGLYQSSWTVSNLYTGIILSAMGVDFMPRLSKVIDDKAQAVRLINEQIIFGVVVSSVFISAILLFSKEMLYILYAKEFEAAAVIVRWHIVGVFLRVVAFPFSYTLLANGKAVHYAVAQIVFWAGDFFLLVLCSNLFGFDGLGVNYPVAYLGYLAMTFCVSRKICGFAFSKEAWRVFAVLCFAVGMAWGWSSVETGNVWLRWGGGTLVLGCHCLYVDRYLRRKMGLNLWLLVKRKLGKR